MTDKALPIATKLIAQYEGFTPVPVRDVARWEIGYGFNYLPNGIAVTADTPHMTEAQALPILAALVARALTAVRGMVEVPISNNQAGALASFAYNLGTAALRTSTLLRVLNAGDYADAADRFGGWVYAGGAISPGLVKRRAAEKALFLTPDVEG